MYICICYMYIYLDACGAELERHAPQCRGYPLRRAHGLSHPTPSALFFTLQGYLTYKKTHPP